MEEVKKSESNPARFTNFLIIAEWVTIAGLFFGSFYFMQSQMQSMTLRIDAQALAQSQRNDTQSLRSDALQQEFIQLLKAMKMTEAK